MVSGKALAAGDRSNLCTASSLTYFFVKMEIPTRIVIGNCMKKVLASEKPK